MTVGIVAKGPRHLEYPVRRAECDATIAVNQAAAWYPCQWWAFGDAETRLSAAPVGFPRWMIPRYAAWRLNRKGVAVPPDCLWWDDFGQPETQFSAVAALHLAKHLGASRVLCFGVVDPEPSPGESPRWARERRAWDETVAALGLSIERA